MAQVLRSVQSNCGEKPQVGKVFRVKGSNSDAVFFTVTNRAQGNVPVAGMLIATQTGPKTVEAAMVTDDAARFSSTVNPLLSQLFSVWHPGGAPATANAPMGTGHAPGGAPAGPGSMPAAAGGGGVPPMRQVTLPDSTASLSLPAGWNVDPKSGGGTARVNGPQGESIMLNGCFAAEDPRAPGYQAMARMGQKPPHTVILQSNVDMAKSFVDIWQALRASGGQGPAPMTIEKVDLVPGSQQGQCVNATFQINPDGKGMKETGATLCRAPVNQSGFYSFTLSMYQLPLGASDQKRATATAIMASFKANMQLVQARANAAAAPIINQMQQTYQAHTQALMSLNQAWTARTQQIGAQATARMQSTEAANQAQWSSFDRQENNISRQGQGFSNYLLDQSVIQNNNVGGTGMVGHATMWNSTADALVKSDPNKYQIVNTPGYWNGVDY
jgi:hypothetical protein